jgi:hypothetical protein
MIWLHPPPPHPVSKINRRHTGRLIKRDNLLTGEGVGEEPNHTTARKPGPLYNITYSRVPTLTRMRLVAFLIV